MQIEFPDSFFPNLFVPESVSEICSFLNLILNLFVPESVRLFWNLCVPESDPEPVHSCMLLNLFQTCSFLHAPDLVCESPLLLATPRFRTTMVEHANQAFGFVLSPNLFVPESVPESVPPRI